MNSAPFDSESRLIIITDIDGTLLDRDTYLPGPAEEVVSKAVAQGVPVVLCSSKTRAEQRYIRHRLGIRAPYVVENGGAVIIPSNAFGPEALPSTSTNPGDIHRTIVLGKPVGQIRAALADVRQELGLSLTLYSDLPLEEVGRLTGLDPCATARAMRRQHSETIVSPLSDLEVDRLRNALLTRGLAVSSGGRFHTVSSAMTDKGTAIELLLSLYRARHGSLITLGLGDSENDHSMLAVVDHPYVVQHPDGNWHSFQGLNVTRIPLPGPAGWAKAVSPFLMMDDN